MTQKSVITRRFTQCLQCQATSATCCVRRFGLLIVTVEHPVTRHLCLSSYIKYPNFFTWRRVCSKCLNIRCYSQLDFSLTFQGNIWQQLLSFHFILELVNTIPFLLTVSFNQFQLPYQKYILRVCVWAIIYIFKLFLNINALRPYLCATRQSIVVTYRHIKFSIVSHFFRIHYCKLAVLYCQLKELKYARCVVLQLH